MTAKQYEHVPKVGDTCATPLGPGIVEHVYGRIHDQGYIVTVKLTTTIISSVHTLPIVRVEVIL